MPIPAVEGHALVAGVALVVLFGFDVRERLRVEELILLDVQLADRQTRLPSGSLQCSAVRLVS